MIIPISPSLLYKIPCFKILFESRYEGFVSDFCDSYNFVLNTDPERNFRLFNNFYLSLSDTEQKIIVHNLSIYYFRYQKHYWNKRPYLNYKVLFWESEFSKLLPSYDENYDAKMLIKTSEEPEIDSITTITITSPLPQDYILRGLDMLYLNEIVPLELQPAYTLSILAVYYQFSDEIRDILNIDDPMPKLI